MQDDLDYIIVGQGLAGTVLSFQLLEAGKKILVVDNAHHKACTNVAAGIINPVTGRRYVKSWMIDDLLPYALATYTKLEKLLKVKLVYKGEILRGLDTEKQENDWMARTGDPAYKEYIEEPRAFELPDAINKAPTYGLIKQSIQVNLSLLIASFAEYLKQKNLLLSEKFQHKELSHSEGKVSFKGRTAHKIIFCEGHQIIHNPFFSQVPNQPNKGECFILSIPGLEISRLIRSNIFLVPQGDVFWSGGNYQNGVVDDTPSEKFKEEYKVKVSEMLNGDYSIVEHKAGIRCSSKDRRPLIGFHPEHQQMILFNGFGTKGTSLVPYFGSHLISVLEQKEKLNPAVNITRYD